MASWGNQKQEKMDRLITLGMSAGTYLFTVIGDIRRIRKRYLGAPSAQAKTHPLPSKPLGQMTIEELLFTPKVRKMKADPFRKEKTRRRSKMIGTR